MLAVIAGPNGSGKTSMTEEFLRYRWLQDCEYINPDNIAQSEFGDWNSAEAVLKAANRAQEMREHCLRDGRDMAFETVMSTAEKVGFLLRAKNAGFFVRMFFVGTDSPDINASRISRRVRGGGHDVPIPKIISRFERSLANCIKSIAIADRAYVYDNSIDFVEPKLLFRTVNGQLTKQYGEINDWARPIAEASSSRPGARTNANDTCGNEARNESNPAGDDSEQPAGPKSK